jgi:glycosyltransferase involved in cell wall biosynthesis
MSGRVLNLLGPSAGGIRVHVAELTRQLRSRGWIVDVAGPAGVMTGLLDHDDGLPEQHAAQGSLRAVAVSASWSPLALQRARAQLRPALDGIDVIHAHGLKAALVALTMRRRPPVVLTIHNLVAGTRTGGAARVLGRVERAVVARADHVIVISDEIEARIADLVPPDRRSFVLPVAPHRTVTATRHGVRADLGIADDAPTVTIVARHHPQKDLPMFLRAMAIVRERVPAARAIIVGDGPDRALVEAERDELGLADVVVIAGFRPNPVDEMHAADVVALSSRWEGSPLAVAECLSIGAPLVTTAVGTVTRHLVDGESALIVPVGDVRRFADALGDVLLDHDLALRIGAAGQAVGQRVFALDALVEPLERIYRSVTRRR